MIWFCLAAVFTVLAGIGAVLVYRRYGSLRSLLITGYAGFVSMELAERAYRGHMPFLHFIYFAIAMPLVLGAGAWIGQKIWTRRQAARVTLK